MGDEKVVRYAYVQGPPKTIEQYLPDNYKVVGYVEADNTIYTYIEGSDLAGWTLEGYVKPRLESGLWFGLEDLLVDPMLGTENMSNIHTWPEE